MLLRPGQVVVYDRAFSLDSDPGVLAKAFELGTKTQTTLKIEAADTATFGELAQIMRAAGAAGYLRFEHSDPNGKRLHKTTTPGGGALAPVKKAEISAKALNAGIQPVVPAVLECYNTALGDDPTLSGTVEISITITPQGNVSGTEVKKGIESHLDRCVAEAVEETSFGAPGGTVVTSFPFNLAPR
jgi:TonB family protein